MNWNKLYILLMFFSIITTYMSGVFIEKDPKRKKLWLVVGILVNLLILFFFKYYNFFRENMVELLKRIELDIDIPIFNLILPVGISFYIFQALGYIIDVYRKEITSEKNIGKYSLFISFFPQLVAGPIERSKHLLPQINREIKFDYTRIKDGILLILLGILKKVVIADRAAIIVNTVYNDVYKYTGIPLILASFFFAIQIYCDFSAYSTIAIGSAKILGYDLMENFKRPYLSTSIKEFWQRWHISLGLWFKDYLYIPLGGNKKRKYVNILVIFLVSGLWHGASWNFLIWGILHGIYQIIEIKFEAITSRYQNIKGYKILKVIRTFILVNFAWIFFRANNLVEAKYIILNLFVLRNFEVKKQLYSLGLDKKEVRILLISIIILVIIEILNIKREYINKIPSLGRWLFYYLLIFSIIIFGDYGNNINGIQFIYFQF